MIGRTVRHFQTIETGSAAGCDWSLAPDGSENALYRSGEAEAHIRFIALDGRKDREITVKRWGGLQSIDWSPDGKLLYCGSISSQDATVVCIDTDGRARVLWTPRGASATWAPASPDGRHLAMSGQIVNSNLWMLGGF